MLHSISGRRPAETLGAFRIPAYRGLRDRSKGTIWRPLAGKPQVNGCENVQKVLLLWSQSGRSGL